MVKRTFRVSLGGGLGRVGSEDGPEGVVFGDLRGVGGALGGLGRWGGQFCGWKFGRAFLERSEMNDLEFWRSKKQHPRK